MEKDVSEIGQQYFYGDGRRKNFKKAFPFLIAAAEKGDSHCQNLVGYCYDHGLGVEQDSGKAYYWYNVAAKNEDLDGIYNLAIYHDSNNDHKRAFALYLKAAKLGDPPSQCNLALAYLEGSGTSLNTAEGVKWMQKAARKGDTRAQYNLGAMYLSGEGVRRNTKHAVAWLSKAARDGHKKAKDLLEKISGEYGMGSSITQRRRPGRL
jgi:TPR repeat protein